MVLPVVVIAFSLCIVLHLFFVRDNPEDQSLCLVEAYRLLRSNAYQLHLVIQQNQLVQDLVTFFLSCGVCIHTVDDKNRYTQVREPY